jgi:hypothetical protein
VPIRFQPASSEILLFEAGLTGNIQTNNISGQPDAQLPEDSDAQHPENLDALFDDPLDDDVFGWGSAE